VKKIILGSMFALLASVNASAGVEVQGRGLLSLGENVARSEAIKNALVEASYRNNAYVSSVTEMEKLTIKESNTLIKTNTLIKEHSVVQEWECGNYYCVVLNVEYAEKVEINEELSSSRLFVRLKPATALNMQHQGLFDSLEREVLSSLNGFNGISIVDKISESDMSVSITLDFKEMEQGFLSFVLSDKVKVSGSVRLDNRSSNTSSGFSIDDFVDVSGESEALYSVASQIRALISSLYLSLPSASDYLVSTIEGKKVFLKSNKEQIGSIYEVVFDDLKNKTEVIIPAVVVSVFREDVILELSEYPATYFRLKKLNKIAN